MDLLLGSRTKGLETLPPIYFDVSTQYIYNFRHALYGVLGAVGVIISDRT